MAVVEAKELGRRYGDVWGLKKASFTVEEGELVVLAGPNGAGKTTAVRILPFFPLPFWDLYSKITF